MHYTDAEGEYNPWSCHRAGTSFDAHDCARESWGSLVGEARDAVRVPLDEMAMLARMVTAETITHSHLHTAAPRERSPYSLLIEPALFKFSA
ncbi:MAG TPA: hypothetical protein VIU46_08885 [Gallionellaceae bacterium]